MSAMSGVGTSRPADSSPRPRAPGCTSSPPTSTGLADSPPAPAPSSVAGVAVASGSAGGAREALEEPEEPPPPEEPAAAVRPCAGGPAAARRSCACRRPARPGARAGAPRGSRCTRRSRSAAGRAPSCTAPACRCRRSARRRRRRAAAWSRRRRRRPSRARRGSRIVRAVSNRRMARWQRAGAVAISLPGCLPEASKGSSPPVAPRRAAAKASAQALVGVGARRRARALAPSRARSAGSSCRRAQGARRGASGSPAGTTSPLRSWRTSPPAAAPTASVAMTGRCWFMASLATSPHGSRKWRVAQRRYDQNVGGGVGVADLLGGGDAVGADARARRRAGERRAPPRLAQHVEALLGHVAPDEQRRERPRSVRRPTGAAQKALSTAWGATATRARPSRRAYAVTCGP